MTKVTLEIDEGTLARVASVARARHLSVEGLLKERAEDLVRLAPVEIDNPAHRKILSVLERPADYYETAREALNDRDLARAEHYADNRKRLLELVDETQGDMGAQRWDRGQLHER
jgi:hypothetical protein